MNKFYILILALIISISTKAQINVAAEAGVVNSSLGTNGSSEYSYFFGVPVTYTKDKLLLESGLHYKRNKAELKNIDNQFSFIDRVQMEMNYLVLPVIIGRNINISDQIQLVPKVGLFAAYGINGDAVLSSGVNNERTEIFNQSPIGFGSSNSMALRPMDRFNMGGKIAVECKFSKFSINGSYNIGFLEQMYMYTKIYHSNWDLSLRYYIK